MAPHHGDPDNYKGSERRDRIREGTNRTGAVLRVQLLLGLSDAFAMQLNSHLNIHKIATVLKRCYREGEQLSMRFMPQRFYRLRTKTRMLVYN